MSIEVLKKKFMNMIFSIYMFLLISVHISASYSMGGLCRHKRPIINIIPWESTIEIYKKHGLGVVIEDIGGNLILLAPLIFFICYYFKKLRFNIKNVLMMSLFISLS